MLRRGQCDGSDAWTDCESFDEKVGSGNCLELGSGLGLEYSIFVENRCIEYGF